MDLSAIVRETIADDFLCDSETVKIVNCLLASDASTWDWGLATPGGTFSWPHRMPARRIYLQEMAAALWSLAVARRSGCRHPLLFTDNIAVAFNLARRRVSVRMAGFFLRTIRELHFHVAYVPTAHNPADGPSRGLQRLPPWGGGPPMPMHWRAVSRSEFSSLSGRVAGDSRFLVPP